MSDNSILVPVSESTTLRQTVEYATRLAPAEDGPGRVRFIYLHPPEAAGDRQQADSSGDGEPTNGDTPELLNRVCVWAREDSDELSESITIETSQIGRDQYLFGPEDIAEALDAETEEHGIGRIVLDPEYDPGIGVPSLRPLQVELRRVCDVDVEEAPVTAPARRSPIEFGGTALQTGAIFGVSFLFYQTLAGTFELFDLVTGTVSATMVAVGLSQITLSRNPTAGSIFTLLRALVYLPYLLWEIVKTNVQVSAAILHPRLPIDPRMTRITPMVWGGLPLTILANSITLTPGTMTVRVEGRSLKVHTLLPASRDGLFDGGLERGVRFVFFGRSAMRIPSLRERRSYEILNPATDGIEESSSPENRQPQGGAGE